MKTTKRLAEASREPNGATPNPFLVTYHFTMKKLLYLELHYDVVFLITTSTSATPQRRTRDDRPEIAEEEKPHIFVSMVVVPSISLWSVCGNYMVARERREGNDLFAYPLARG
jgi:hypothetical protein